MKWLWRSLAALPVLLAIGLAGGYLWLRSSLPQIDGEIVLRGLSAPVEVVRDSNAIPHIFARSGHDAYFALGFIHAQDRLWQMDMQRRAGAGRLAEIVGPSALRLDRFVRTMGIYRLAERTYYRLDAPTKAALTAYADGVNAYLAHKAGAWPLEFHLLDYDPEPWVPADSVVWGRLMALRLSTNWQNELLRARLHRKLSGEQVAALWPPYPADGPVTIAANEKRNTVDVPHLTLDRLWAALPGGRFGYGASNEWVLDGRLTDTGAPILANDPHLGLSLPSQWYLARIDTPDLTLAGATAPGTPFLLLGHNGQIAWGFTTTYADTDDVFIEQIDPEDPNRYLTAGGPQPIVRREESIKVRGGETVTMNVSETHHGPILDELSGKSPARFLPPGQVLALAAPWLKSDDRTTEAILWLNRATDWPSFKSALERFHAPVQNIAYADVMGNIGIYTPGRIPVRKAGNGYLPVPGWSGEFDWTGFIPFDELPHRYNPPGGLLINANNRIADDNYPHFLSTEWGETYRARRIGDLLAGHGPHSVETTAEIQADTVSYAARDMLPLMLEAELTGSRERAAADLLAAWDGRMDRGRPEPLIFTAWFRELNRALYADELGETFEHYWGLRPVVVSRMLQHNREWCDDVTTESVESCSGGISTALTTALGGLTERYGDDMGAWRWGVAHYADLRHKILDYVPLLRDFVNIQIETDGGEFTVNRAGTSIRDPAAPFSQRHGPSYRGIYDLSNLDNSRFMYATGQSGNPLSPHFRDFAERWRDVEYVELRGSKEELATSAIGVLVLTPEPTDE